jgi:hypothetical protein
VVEGGFVVGVEGMRMFFVYSRYGVGVITFESDVLLIIHDLVDHSGILCFRFSLAL